MDDTISRKAALDALADYIHNADRVYSTGKLTHEDCMDAAHSVLDELPSARQWIPCSERLPEKDGKYLTTTEDGLCDVWHYCDGGWDYDDGVAWMPLPAPWKGKQNG